MANLIAVTGNGGSGKTIFSFFLAKSITARGKNVILLSTDSLQPGCPLLFPSKKIDTHRSLGRLLSLAVITKGDVFDSAGYIDGDMMMFSYADGESHLNYPDISAINLQSLFHQLDNIADVVIVDTSTAHNAIDRYALEKNPSQIFLATADSKGDMYRDFYRPDGAVQILYNNSKFNPLSDIANAAHPPIKYILPCFKQLECVYNGIDITDVVIPRRYRKIIDKVLGELI